MKRGLDSSKRKQQPTAVNRLHHHENNSSPAEPAIKPLDEAKAVEVGSEFIGEAIVFIVAGTLLVMDQLSNRQREQERRADIERRMTDMSNELAALKTKIESQIVK
mgnify:FL=1